MSKELDLKMKKSRATTFGWTDEPTFEDMVDGIGIDPQGVAYNKENTEKIPAAKKQKLDLPNKDDAVKDDNANVHTGEDSTGFGYVGAFEQFMSACRQSGGSLEHCVEAWKLKNSGVGMTDEKVALMKEYAKGKQVDTLQYKDFDYEKLKSDFGLDLKPIIEKLNRVDGICANNKKLVAENKALKEDFVEMKGVLDAVNLTWLKKADERKLELKKVLIEEFKVSDDFLNEKDLPELEDYVKLLELAKNTPKDDGIKLSPEQEYKRDMNDKDDGIDMRFHGNPIINDFEGYMDNKMERVKKDDYNWEGK